MAIQVADILGFSRILIFYNHFSEWAQGSRFKVNAPKIHTSIVRLFNPQGSIAHLPLLLEEKGPGVEVASPRDETSSRHV